MTGEVASGEAEEKKDEESSQNGPEEKLAQAEAIYSLIKSMQEDIDRLAAEFAEAERVHIETASACLSKHVKLFQAHKKYDAQKESLSEFIVDMYKQGGYAPYYDVLLRSTTYEEFLSSWYMLNEVSLYGEESIRGVSEQVKTLTSEAEALDKTLADAESTMKQARVKMKRAELSKLALAPQAAELRMEAAELSNDSEAFEEAKADYEASMQAFEQAKAEGLMMDVVLEGEGIFTNPCPGAVYSSGFGYRSFDNAFHKGLDMAISEGTPYYAAESGTVTAATNDGGYNGGAGNWVVIDHGKGLTTTYMHSLATLVKPGDHVERGQIIGLVGNTGNSFGAHLHFQVEINGVAVNPVMYL